MEPQLPKKPSAISGRVLLVIFLVASLTMTTVYFREGSDGLLHAAQNTVAGITTPFKIMGGAVGSGTEAVGDAIEEASTSEETWSSLREENEYLRNELTQLEEYRQEAQRLETLLGLQDNYNLQTVGARVTYRSMNAWEQIISIDKGSDAGIIEGLPVMGPTGVVGQVISTTASSSEIRLLSDPLSGVSVILQSSRSQGIVQGSLEGLLYLENVDADASVEVGDVVITSGLGGSYFRGLTVGTVVKVDQDQGGASRKIVVSPNESVGLLEEVLVVLSMGSEGDLAQNVQVPANDNPASSDEGEQDGAAGDAGEEGEPSGESTGDDETSDQE